MALFSSSTTCQGEPRWLPSWPRLCSPEAPCPARIGAAAARAARRSAPPPLPRTTLRCPRLPRAAGVTPAERRVGSPASWAAPGIPPSGRRVSRLKERDPAAASSQARRTGRGDDGKTGGPPLHLAVRQRTTAAGSPDWYLIDPHSCPGTVNDVQDSRTEGSSATRLVAETSHCVAGPCSCQQG